MRRFRATVRWIGPESGGRTIPPTGPVYRAPVSIGSLSYNGPVAFDLTVQCLEKAENGYVWTALVSFLIPDAPSELLVEGAAFELFEGRKRVATGTLIAPE